MPDQVISKYLLSFMQHLHEIRVDQNITLITQVQSYTTKKIQNRKNTTKNNNKKQGTYLQT